MFHSPISHLADSHREEKSESVREFACQSERERQEKSASIVPSEVGESYPATLLYSIVFFPAAISKSTREKSAYSKR